VPASYSSADLAVGSRIADCIALQRYRTNGSPTSATAAKSCARARRTVDLHDELLGVAHDTGELKEVFEHVSEIAKKVLPHDALSLALILPDGRHARVLRERGLLLAGRGRDPARAVLAQKGPRFT
jgi:hypothetical protein